MNLSYYQLSYYQLSLSFSYYQLPYYQLYRSRSNQPTFLGTGLAGESFSGSDVLLRSLHLLAGLRVDTIARLAVGGALDELEVS